jgi:hypothetical protein
MTGKTLQVEQVDRERAWPFVSRNSIAGTDREGFFAGKYDDSRAVQAFAKHRLDALTSLPTNSVDVEQREVIARIIAPLAEQARDKLYEGSKLHQRWQDALTKADQILAALSGSPLVREAGSPAYSLEYWFFKYLNDDQRRALISCVYGAKAADEARNLGLQRRCLRHLLASLQPASLSEERMALKKVWTMLFDGHAPMLEVAKVIEDALKGGAKK